MTSEDVAVVAAVLFAAVAGLVAAGWYVSSRRHLDRLRAVARRFDTPEVDDGGGISSAVDRLERTVAAAVTAREAASDAELRLSHALRAIEEGIVLLDEHGDVVFENPAAAVFTGARHGEALVESAVRFLAGEAVVGRSSTRTVELFGPPRRTLVLRARPLDDGRRAIGAIVVIEDVTERRRIDAVRRDFVANISHELKTPVGGLGVLAETIVDEADIQVIHRLARRMLHEAMRASRTIDDLLELSRIEVGGGVVREPVGVDAVVTEAVDRASTAAQQRGISIDVAGGAAEAVVLGDRRQLVSAVFNLLDNAVKYSPSGSSIVVRSAVDGNVVRLGVADRGVGIPRSDLDRIFERFYRVDRARSRETGGTGLGLAIVRHAVANHGGEVEVESSEGEGSTFTLVLPVAPRPTGGEATEDVDG